VEKEFAIDKLRLTEMGFGYDLKKYWGIKKRNNHMEY